ncbi:uncharacterized protein [Parasteatoda tepidariorum]|uniref:uncharacterized protein isoform X2 n=1 Tax=Parasteatoda tepidariorum TaxID=114398 RepID=UPI001C725485|nr:OVARIAN TUMOR DOMAIN-containing deubiquitinating enzyme 2 isoform X2 [Parasteatoda tepidariorum]
MRNKKTMATSSFAIRCISASGRFTISELESSSTVKALKESIMKVTEIQPEKMKILSGYPPKPIKLEHDNSKLDEVGIESGETLIIQVDETLNAQAVPDVNKPTSSESPKKRKQELPPVMKQMKEFSNGAPDIMPGIMMRYDVPSNNSCLFSSVYFLVHNGLLELAKSDKLRRIIADAVSKDPVKYNDAFLGRENSEYCRWILNQANWGGAIELAILSEFFKLEICAIDIMSCQMLRFGESNNYQRRGIVVYDGIHYDPLYMQREEKLQTIFHVSDTQILELALEVAREARSSKQFTDIVNFKLKCNDCGQNLIGEKDASAHAAATGHVSFGELL